MADVNVGSIQATLSVDARAWQQGLTQATQQLATFQQSVGRIPPALQQVQQGMAGIGTATGQMSQQMQHATSTTSAWTSALQVAGGIGLATSIGAMTTAIVAFSRETVQVGARLEQMRASFSAIAGSAAAGQQQFQFLTATAQQLGVTLEPIARGWRTLTAAATQANLPLADQQRLLVALTTEARRVGASNEELNRAIIAVSQSASKGKLSMEELRQQLGEALPTAFAATARGMGRTTEELEKLIETGSVRFPAFARALTRGFEQMQAASGQMTETSQASFNRLTNSWVLMQDTIMKSGLNTYLVTVANNLREAVEWTTRLVSGRSGAAGPTMGDLGATPEQAQEIKRLQGIIGPYSRMAETAENPAHRAQYAAMVERAKEQLEQVLATVRGTEDQAAAQAKVTAEVSKTAAAREIEADYVTDVTKKLTELRKAQDDYRREAALAPERMGRPGTPEFLKGMQQVTGTQLEALTRLVAQPPQGATIPDELRRQLAAVDSQYGQLGRTIDGIREKESARARAAREAATAERQEARELEREIVAERRERIRDLDIFGLLLSPEQEAELKEQAREQRQRIQAFAREGDLLGLALSPELERQRRQEGDFTRRLQGDLETALASREQRPEARLRARAQREGLAITPEQDVMLRRLTTIREEQERLNTALRLYEDFAGSIGNAWSAALTSIADGTKTVAEAFRAMAQSILQSMTQIASQEATRALFRLGAGLLTGALTGGAGAPAGTFANPGGLEVMFAQHGAGPINAPTLAMLGEGPASTLPEYVLNRQQMASVMSSGSGQQSSVIVNNFPSRQAAEEDAARQRSQGHTVIVNAILDELSTGESSRINRAMRALQR